MLDTPIPLLEMALRGTMKFVVDTSPFASRRDEDADDEFPADSETATADLVDFLSRRSKGRPPP
ncbi:hypothetical protein [Azospirillum agricola]|uniref:hypothetical protein n=1 Tax=Azospirillum agricola TaxID=1720247 RepID=UPI00117807BC|nr:hypothetical protein [Azospirillum agricola]